jgi:hypothetical protein
VCAAYLPCWLCWQAPWPALQVALGGPVFVCACVYCVCVFVCVCTCVCLGVKGEWGQMVAQRIHARIIVRTLGNL